MNTQERGKPRNEEDEPLEPRACEECQRVYTPKQAWQKYCRPKCGNKARFRRYAIRVARRGGHVD